MNKKLIIGCLLAVFLMMMIPNVSAVEYNEVKESQEQIIENKLSTQLNELLAKIESLKSNSLFNDPGDGEDENGPDDLTDWIYLVFLMINLPVSLISLGIWLILESLFRIISRGNNVLPADIVVFLLIKNSHYYSEYIDDEDYDGDGR